MCAFLRDELSTKKMATNYFCGARGLGGLGGLGGVHSKGPQRVTPRSFCNCCFYKAEGCVRALRTLLRLIRGKTSLNSYLYLEVLNPGKNYARSLPFSLLPHLCRRCSPRRLKMTTPIKDAAALIWCRRCYLRFRLCHRRCHRCCHRFVFIFLYHRRCRRQFLLLLFLSPRSPPLLPLLSGRHHDSQQKLRHSGHERYLTYHGRGTIKGGGSVKFGVQH